MSPSTVRRTRLLLNLCDAVLCTLSAGLLNAMKRIKLTLVQFCFVYYGKREQIRISWTILLKRLFYDHRTFMFLCDVLSSKMQRNLGESRCWGFCESLRAGNDAVLSFKKNGEIKSFEWHQKSVLILHVTNDLGVIWKGHNHKENAKIFLWWTQTEDCFYRTSFLKSANLSKMW